MRVAVAFDHRGVHLREAVIEALAAHDVIDFGTQRYVFALPGVGLVPAATSPVDIDSRIHVVKGGINYRFNWGGI